MYRNKRLKSNGYILPYTLLLMIFLINMFIFSLRLYFNEVNYYKKKNNHYQVLVYEERIKRHIVDEITSNRAKHLGKEEVNYEDAVIFITYVYNYTRNEWGINVTINEQDIRLKRNYLFDVEAEQLTDDTG